MTRHGPSVYAHEKLLTALESLATGAGDVRARLLTAYQTIHPLTQGHFPPRLRKDFSWVLRQLTKRGPIYDYKQRLDRGSVEETLRHIRKATGVRIATRIYRLYHALDADIRRSPAPSNSRLQATRRKPRAPEPER